MNSNYAKALQGLLCSTEDGERKNLAIKNALPIPLRVLWLSTDGQHWGYNPETAKFQDGLPGYELGVGREVTVADVPAGYFFLLADGASGAFAAVVGGTDGSLVDITSADLLDPGDVGPIPQPRGDRLVPGHAPRVLVGCGRLTSGRSAGKSTAREQYWALSGDSYSLAPKEKRTISFTQVAGMESTTSQQTTLADSLGLDAQAGWGPISVSLSASLSTASSTFQQVTLTNQTTNFVSHEVTNDSETDPVLVLVWQVVDVVTVYNKAGVPEATATSLLSPPIVQPHELRALNETQERVRVTPDMRRAAPAVVSDAETAAPR
jgi:hypothetical protein